MEAERPNKGWVRFLTVLVGFLTVLAILSTWVDRQIFDTQEWGDTSSKMLQDPVIQKEVAAYAVDELYDNVDVEAELKDIFPTDLEGFSGIASGALRQFADRGAQQALANQRVQDLWRQANETAHRNLIAIIEDDSTVISSTDGKVQLELRPLIIEIADQVGLGQQARDKIPDAVGRIEIVDSQELSTVQTVAQVIHGTALITALLLLVLIGLAVFLSKGYRWLTLLWIAASLIIGAVVVLIVRSVAGGLIVPELSTVEVRPAAEAAYSIGTDLLRSIAWTVIWSALVLIPLAWLVSPNGAAEKTRKFLAVPFGRFPAATFGLLGIVAFIFVLMGAGDQREFLIRLSIVILAGLGTWGFSRTLAASYPDADYAGLAEFGETAKSRVKQAWSDRPDILPSRGGDKGDPEGSSEGSGPPAGGTAASVASTDDAPTEVIAAAEQAAGQPDPETARLDLLDRLASMRERGVLTDEEYAEEKTRVNARLKSSGG